MLTSEPSRDDEDWAVVTVQVPDSDPIEFSGRTPRVDLSVRTHEGHHIPKVESAWTIPIHPVQSRQPAQRRF